MKLKIPAQVKEVCDFCQRDGVLRTCLVCGKEFCLSCQSMIAGCMVRPKICKECDDRKDVQAIVSRYGWKISAVRDKRDAELRRLAAKKAALDDLD